MWVGGVPYRCAMARRPLPHNPLNGVTASVEQDGQYVRKVLTARGDGPAHWRASEHPRNWNYWRREALAYEHGLPERLGLAAPRLISTSEDDGEVLLVFEFVEGRTGAALTVGDLEVAAAALGRSQARPVEDLGWLSQDFLRDYSQSRPANWTLLASDEAWAQPLVARYFQSEVRAGLLRLHEERGRLLDLVERLPRAVCHLDVWPNNLIARADGEVVFVDWSFCGDGALGEDVGNLIPDSVFDLLQPRETLGELDRRLTAAYLDGLRQAGWSGDPRLVRLGICASAVKYDWLTAHCLEHASAEQHLAYGRGASEDADERYAARAAGLALCAAWADEALQLSDELRLGETQS